MAVSPIDGRYRARTRALEGYFSEFALIRARLRVEIEWYLSLARNRRFAALKPLAPATARKLRAIGRRFTIADAAEVKAIEAEINHDVKAVEYFLKRRVAMLGGGLAIEMVHFALTSEDVNNLAWALNLKGFIESVMAPRLEALERSMAAMARRLKKVVMLARTHGQEASPTTMGKEMAVFCARLRRQLSLLRGQQYLGKLNGAVGNFNAHRFACPGVDWQRHSRRFVESLGLEWNPITTQIEPHDFLAELFGTMVRVDTILLDFCRDMWSYISRGYFAQCAISGETGSSTMPHKVNPIDFENAEGNLGLANAIFAHLATKLPISRLQRDLSDSTALRSTGTAFGYAFVAVVSMERALERVEINRRRIDEDLEAESSWDVLAEAIQTLMRLRGIPRPYETLKELTRGRKMGQASMRRLISSLPLAERDKARLLRLRPRDYRGLAPELVDLLGDDRPIPDGPRRR